jgi:hypothetical protein
MTPSPHQVGHGALSPAPTPADRGPAPRTGPGADSTSGPPARILTCRRE